jgi:hypothetical protein
MSIPTPPARLTFCPWPRPSETPIVHALPLPDFTTPDSTYH